MLDDRVKRELKKHGVDWSQLNSQDALDRAMKYYGILPSVSESAVVDVENAETLDSVVQTFAQLQGRLRRTAAESIIRRKQDVIVSAIDSERVRLGEIQDILSSMRETLNKLSRF